MASEHKLSPMRALSFTSGLRRVVHYIARSALPLTVCGAALAATARCADIRLASTARVALFILMFVVMRDCMTPSGLWTIGSRGVRRGAARGPAARPHGKAGVPHFWLRLPRTTVELLILAAGSLAVCALFTALEPRLAANLWVPAPASPLPGGRVSSAVTGLFAVATAWLVAAPVSLFNRAMGGRPPKSRMAAWYGSAAHKPRLASVRSLAAVAMALCGNLLEELLFRGFFMALLAQQYGVTRWRAAVASGLAFAVCHVHLAYVATDAGASILLFTLWEGCIAGLVRAACGLPAAAVTHGMAIAFLDLGVCTKSSAWRVATVIASATVAFALHSGAVSLHAVL